MEIQATRTSYSVLLAHAPHVTEGSDTAYRAWWARVLREVSARVDLTSVLVLADVNSVVRAEDRGSRRPGGEAWGEVCADHAMRDLSEQRPSVGRSTPASRGRAAG